MVRILAVLSAFLFSLIILLLFQPSRTQQAAPEVPAQDRESAITRDDVNLLEQVADTETQPDTPIQPDALDTLIQQALEADAKPDQFAEQAAIENALQTLRPEPSDTLQAALQPHPLQGAEGELESMTWAVLSNLDKATGRATDPGAPGSLLNVLVRRSLEDGAQHLPALEQAYVAKLAKEAGARAQSGL